VSAAPARHFASDNNAGAHPEVLAALAAANAGHVRAYGDDELTARVERRFRALFGEQSRSFLVFGGTAANVLGLQSALRPHEAVICAEQAHINVDECGAPERFLGCKLLTVAAPDARLTVQAVARRVTGVGDQHHVQPRAISITQSTEYGTVYSPAEVRALADFAHANGMVLHMDGARIANAAASLGLPVAAFTTDAGVDILSFGGTKNGLLAAEAVVFLDSRLAEDFRFIRKQGMQLASKMRFLAAQFDALLEGDLWLAGARHANAMARRLAAGVAGLSGVRITQPVEANAVFAVVPPAAVPVIQERFFFYVWDERTSEVRWMTAFDTSEQDVDAFVACVGGAVSRAAG
jgi:threonine aldolase